MRAASVCTRGEGSFFKKFAKNENLVGARNSSGELRRQHDALVVPVRRSSYKHIINLSHFFGRISPCLVVVVIILVQLPGYLLCDSFVENRLQILNSGGLHFLNAARVASIFPGQERTTLNQK